jgi:sensor histidine kinase YesM
MNSKPNLLHGLNFPRLAIALGINTLAATLLFPIAWEGNFRSALVSTQVVGLCIFISWTMASNLRVRHIPPLVAQMLSVLLGSLVGTPLVILVKGYEIERVLRDPFGAILLLMLGVVVGGFIILTLIARERETRAQAAMHQAEAERHLHAKQLLEARLQLMQAQIEPHFLFNTLASVQHLVETEPAAASRMLTDLIKYLRAAMPQLRERGTTVAREAELARAYLAIQRVRTGNRFDFTIDLPQALGNEPFPPMMLLTLVENAVKHGFEAHAQRGEIRVSAHTDQDHLVVKVEDTGAGFRMADGSASHEGIGLSNVRERLDALYGSVARLELEENLPCGLRASISIPLARPVAGKRPVDDDRQAAPAAAPASQGFGSTF